MISFMILHFNAYCVKYIWNDLWVREHQGKMGGYKGVVPQYNRWRDIIAMPICWGRTDDCWKFQYLVNIYNNICMYNNISIREHPQYTLIIRHSYYFIYILIVIKLWANYWLLWSGHEGEYFFLLTHWGRVTHICFGNLTIIGSVNRLSPGRRQAII